MKQMPALLICFLKYRPGTFSTSICKGQQGFIWDKLVMADPLCWISIIGHILTQTPSDPLSLAPDTLVVDMVN